MPNEPSTGELTRRLDEIARLLQGLVSRPEYTADQRHWEHRFTDLERDLETERGARRAEIIEERDARKTAVADERTAREAGDKVLQDRMDKAGTNWRQTLFSGLLPGLFVLLATAVNVWIALGSGGK